MKKKFINSLLNEYSKNRGYRRSLFGDPTPIANLRYYYETVLSQHKDEDDIIGEELTTLYDLMRRRQISIRNTSDQYYKNDRLTNHLFHKLIFAMAEDLFETKFSLQPAHAKEDKPTFEIRKLTQKVEWEPEAFPHVVMNFSYQAVLGQTNIECASSGQTFEDIDPNALILTDTNELIYLDDVLQSYRDKGVFVAEHQDAFLSRSFITKPLFKQEISKAVDARCQKESKNEAYVTQNMVDEIHQSVKNMHRYYSTASVYDELTKLNHYVHSLPPKSRQALSHHKCQGNSLERIFGWRIMPREAVEGIVEEIATSLQTIVSPIVKDTPGFQHALSESATDEPRLTNGLRLK